MENECPVCQNRNSRRINQKPNLYFCEKCDHTFSLLSENEKELYDDKYYIETHKNWFNYPNYRLFRYILRKTKLTANEKNKLLDIGCGKGDLLEFLNKNDKTLILSGIDINPDEVDFANIIKGDFLIEQFIERFNVVTALALIEHLDKPNAFCIKVKNVLDNDGIMILNTINNRSLIYKSARILKKIGFSTPFERLYSSHHLQHFSNLSLSTLVKRSGFSILEHMNHNYRFKAVDLPDSNLFYEFIFKIFIWLAFILSDISGHGIHQTIVCQKKL